MRVWVVALWIASFFAIGAARADEPPFDPVALNAAQVLAKARQARGSLVPGVYHRVVQYTGNNGTKWQIESYESPDSYVENVRDNGFDSSSGSYHGTAWDRNDNGVVTVESGFHQTENPFSQVMNAPASDASDIRVLGKTTSDPICIVLELKPRNGLLQRRYYDASSFLLLRTETTGYDGETRSYTYSDYRKSYGVTYAQIVSYQDKHPENGWRGQVQTFEPAGGKSVDFTIPKNGPVFDMQGRSAVPIPADFTDHGIIVRVTIAGRGLDLELDSGASTTVIDSDVAQQLGLNVSDVRQESFGGNFAEGRTRIPDLALGDLHAHNLAITAIHFTRRLGDRKIVGLLGGDFFSSGRIEVNFEKETLSMLAPSQDTMPAPWVDLPVQIDDMIPRAHASFNGVRGAFILDLGADDSMLFQHYFAQFHPNSVGDVLGKVEGVAGQAVDFRRYKFARFGLGDLEFADVSAMVPQGTQFEEIGYDGLIGRNVLANFNLIFDYPDHKIYMLSLVQ